MAEKIGCDLIVVGFHGHSAIDDRVWGSTSRGVDCFSFVLNKADRVSERERDEAAAFARRVLPERLGLPVDRIFHVSALARLNNGRAPFDGEALVEHLRRLAHSSGRSLVAQSARWGAVRLAARLQHVLAEEAAALQRPIAESEERLRTLRTAADEACRALLELGPLFAAEEQRIRRTFADRRAMFITARLSEETEVLVRGIRASGERSGPALRQQAFQIAQQVARERIEPWLSESERLDHALLPRYRINGPAGQGEEAGASLGPGNMSSMWAASTARSSNDCAMAGR